MAGRGGGIKKIQLDFNAPNVRNLTVVDLFGKKPINPLQIVKLVWIFIRKHDIRKDNKEAN